ncbi:TonB-dependent receptor [bacterium]|nr:TonB-dependent receptor [bacterium]NUN46007.1 TonB-dependent receptor [bacterium]
MRILRSLLLWSCFYCSSIIGQTPGGTIKGLIIDKETKETLPGANVWIVGTSRGAVTKTDGSFEIKELTSGTYSLSVQYIGYAVFTKPDVIVREQRITPVLIELLPEDVEGETIEVHADYFSATESASTSTTNLSSEEVRRSSAAAGDVSRIIAGLPSVAKTDEQKNSLAVRGGSPTENAFFVDGIEIPNINHFPTQGSSGGAIGILNVDLIQDVNFMTGGFSSAYGDRLSSVLDLRLREGNRDAMDGQWDLNFGGTGGVFEGPFSGKKGSWLFSVRRSYVDIIAKMIDVNVTPWYADAQSKIVYDVGNNHQLSLIHISGYDENNISKKQGKKLDIPTYGKETHLQNTTGLTWRWLWNKKGYTLGVVSFSAIRFGTDFNSARTDSLLIKNKSSENYIQYRQTAFYRFNNFHSLEFGWHAKTDVNHYDQAYGANTDPVGNVIPSMTLNDKLKTFQTGFFATYTMRPFQKLETQIGTRGDYFSYTQRWHVSPRVSVGYELTTATSAQIAAGIYYQNLPKNLLAQNKALKNNNDPYAVHYVAGMRHRFSEDTRLTVEGYLKEYYHMPMDPTQPGLFVVDEIQYRNGFFYDHATLNDDGKARVIGIEVTIQKKLARRFYGIISGTYYQSRYKGLDHRWRDRVFDNRFIAGIEGGFKPNAKWEYSGRFIIAGGAPYTPFNVPASEAAQQAVFDVNQINAKRYPVYHSMNLRADRRFQLSGSNLITYISLWNVYNQKNVASYYWNEIENKKDKAYQWGFVPVFGLEYEF